MASPSDNLDELVKLFQEASAYLSMVTPQFQRVVTAVEELENTLVMVGNNITDQIRMSGTGGGTGNGATAQEQAYQSALLENMNQWLDIINQAADNSLKNANSNAKNIIDALGAIQVNSQPRATNGGAGGRPENMSFKNIISGLQGGLLTATASIGKEFMKFRQQLSIAAGNGGLKGLIASATLLSSVIASMPSAFGEMTKYISSFVSAVDPGLMAKLALASSDLMAVIGSGLRPVIVMVISVIRMFADMMSSVMGSSGAAFNALSQALMSIAIPFITIWAKAIQEMVPVIKNISTLFLDASGSITVFAFVISQIISAVASAFNVLIAIANVFAGTIKTVALMLVEFAKGVVWVINKIPFGTKVDDSGIKQIEDSIANSAANSFANAGTAINDAINGAGNLKYEKDKSIGASAKQASYMGIGDLGKNLMQAAFSSSTEAIAQKQLNAADRANGFLEQIAGFLGVQVNGPQRKAAGVRG